MKLIWYVIPNNDPEDDSGDTKILQLFVPKGTFGSLSNQMADDSNWEDVPEVVMNWRKK